MTLRLLSLPIISIFLAASAHGALVVVAENLPLPFGNTDLFGAPVSADQPSDGELNYRSVGQIFLAQSTGQLYSIEATVDASAGYTPVNPLMISLVSWVDGQRGEILASSLIQASEIPGGPLGYSIDGFSIVARFNEGVLLQEGTLYAIEFSIPTSPADYYVWGNSTLEDAPSDYYPYGFSYQTGTAEFIDPNIHGDYYFRVTVEAPEPSSLLMSALGGVVLLRRRRSR